MKGTYRRTYTGGALNMRRAVEKAQARSVQGAGPQGLQARSVSSDEEDKRRPNRRASPNGKAPGRGGPGGLAVSPAFKPAELDSAPGGIREVLSQQLHAARQDLTQRTFRTLEQLEHACLDSLQQVEASNAHLRRENDRLSAENERLQAQCGSAGGHTGGTGESPSAVRSSLLHPHQQQSAQELSLSVGSRSKSIMTASSAVVPPANKQRPPTPNCADGPPQMTIPGAVPDDAAKLQQIEVISDEEELEDLKPCKSAWKGGTDDEDEDNDDYDKRYRWPVQRRSIFADADRMKAKVREAVMKKEYDVKNFYKDSGIFATIAKSNVFDHLTLGVICLNALWIAFDLDWNTEKFILDAHPFFQVVEFSFCIYFTVEVAIRFVAFRHKRDCLSDAWFVFDTLLVLIMITDTFVITLVVLANGRGNGASTPGGLADPTFLRMFRMLKLTRMARMVRLLRATPELMILIKGLVVALRSVIFTLALLIIFIYLFAIVFRSLTEDMPTLRDELFPSVPHSMLHLLLQGTLPDHESLVMKLWNESYVYGLLAIFFILMTSLTVMNMLVGVLVEVVGVVSTVEKEQMNVQFVYSKLQELITTSGLDADGDMKISKAEFESLLLNPTAARMVQEVGVDVVGLVDFSEYLFQNDSTLSFPEFMDLILQLRGSNGATVKDIVDLRKFISLQVLEINDIINKGKLRPSPSRVFGSCVVAKPAAKQLAGPDAHPSTPSRQTWTNANFDPSPVDNMWATAASPVDAMWATVQKDSSAQLLDEEV